MPLWNKTVTRVVVVEMRRPTFLLITTHRDSKIYKTTRFYQDLFNDCQNYIGQANDVEPPWVLAKTLFKEAFLTLHVKQNMQIPPPIQTYRQQSLNILLQEGGDVLPVHDVI